MRLFNKDDPKQTSDCDLYSIKEVLQSQNHQSSSQKDEDEEMAAFGSSDQADLDEDVFNTMDNDLAANENDETDENLMKIEFPVDMTNDYAMTAESLFKPNEEYSDNDEEEYELDICRPIRRLEIKMLQDGVHFTSC